MNQNNKHIDDQQLDALYREAYKKNTSEDVSNWDVFKEKWDVRQGEKKRSNHNKWLWGSFFIISAFSLIAFYQSNKVSSELGVLNISSREDHITKPEISGHDGLLVREEKPRESIILANPEIKIISQNEVVVEIENFEGQQNYFNEPNDFPFTSENDIVSSITSTHETGVESSDLNEDENGFNSSTLDIVGLWQGKGKRGPAKYDVEMKLWELGSNQYKCIFSFKNESEIFVYDAQASLKDSLLSFKLGRVRKRKTENNPWTNTSGNLAFSIGKKGELFIGECGNSDFKGSLKLKRLPLGNCSQGYISPTQPIKNGGFEKGYLHFESDYRIAELNKYEHIRIVNDAQYFNKIYFKGKGDGCFLAVDGSPYHRKTIWKQNVTLASNTYKGLLKFQLMGIMKSAKQNCALDVYANNKYIGSAKSQSQEKGWQTFEFSFDVTDKQMEFEIKNLSIGGNGNDVAIDNIAIKQFTSDSVSLSLYYYPNKYDLNELQVSRVESIVDSLNKYPDSHITLKGYASDIRDLEKNQELSMNRINEILKILRKSEINRNRISYSAKGEVALKNNPIDLAAQRENNRRVDIEITQIFGEIDY